MQNPFPFEDPDLDTAIASAFAVLASHDPASDEYRKVNDHILRLCALRNETRKLHQKSNEFELENDLERDAHEYKIELDDRPFYARISPDTALTVLGNIAIAIVVIKYEQTGVIRTAVKDFIKKF